MENSSSRFRHLGTFHWGSVKYDIYVIIYSWLIIEWGTSCSRSEGPSLTAWSGPGQFIYDCPLPDQYIPMSPPPIWTHSLPAHTHTRWVESALWLVAWPSPTLCQLYTSTGVAPTHLWEVGWWYILIIGMTDRSVYQHVSDGSHYGTPPLPTFQNFTHKIFKNY